MEAPQLIFDGSRDKYKLWETIFLEHLHTLKLKETILYEPETNEQGEQDRQKTADCYAQLTRLIDEKSLSLIKHEAPGDGRKALKLLREHYSGKSKRRIINLYKSLTKLKMTDNEGVKDFLLRAETVIDALRDAGETPTDELVIAMIINGLPDLFKPLVVDVTEGEDNITFADFKRRLTAYEGTRQLCEDASTKDATNKCLERPQKNIPTETTSSLIMTCIEETVSKIKTEPTDSLIMTCVEETLSKFKTEPEDSPIATPKEETVNKAKAEPLESVIMTPVGESINKNKTEPSHTPIATCVAQRTVMPSTNDIKGKHADVKCSSQVNNDTKKFVRFDAKSQPRSQFVQLAGGSRCSPMVQPKIPTVIYLVDNAGKRHRAELRETLFIPSYPQNIIPVAKASTGRPPQNIITVANTAAGAPPQNILSMSKAATGETPQSIVPVANAAAGAVPQKIIAVTKAASTGSPQKIIALAKTAPGGTPQNIIALAKTATGGPHQNIIAVAKRATGGTPQNIFPLAKAATGGTPQNIVPLSKAATGGAPQNIVPVANAATGGAPFFIQKRESRTVKRSGDRKRNHQDEGPYVKKPLNAFMFFLKEQRKSAEAEVGIKTSSSINKVLGERWKSLPDKEKEKYFTMATLDSHLHAKHHPGWTPKENYGKKRKRARKNLLVKGTEGRTSDRQQADLLNSAAQSHVSILPKLPTYDNPMLLLGLCHKPLGKLATRENIVKRSTPLKLEAEPFDGIDSVDHCSINGRETNSIRRSAEAGRPASGTEILRSGEMAS